MKFFREDFTQRRRDAEDSKEEKDFFREDFTQRREGAEDAKEEFFREDLTRRRGGTENAKEEREKRFNKSLNLKLSYPEARRYSDELTNTASAPQRLCESLLFILFLVLISCQTTPGMSNVDPENANVLPLERGALFYIVADVKKMRPIIERLPIEELKDNQTRQMLDRTNHLAAAVFPQESGRRFQLAAWGNYPASQADFALSFNKNWKKRRSQAGGSYWYSSASRLSLAVGSRQAFAASSLTGDPFDPLSKEGIEIPEGFADFRGNAGVISPFSCWLENPAILISRIMNDLGLPLGIPVQKLFINLLPTQDEKYETLIRLQFENASYARNMIRIFNMAAGFIPVDSDMALASLFLANPPVLNGSNVDIRSAVMDEEEIVQLLGLFTLF
jgi:hypothetical protein